MNLLARLLIGAAGYESGMQAKELLERHHYYNAAKNYCAMVGKPLLRIGMRRSVFEPPNGDYTLDIDEAVLRIPGGVVGDERAIPFSDKFFGASFNEHTLEHLHTAEDVEKAIRECCRVADHAILLAPSPYSIIGLLHPDHKLRMWFRRGNNIVVKQLRMAAQTSQAMVINNPWEVTVTNT